MRQRERENRFYLEPSRCHDATLETYIIFYIWCSRVCRYTSRIHAAVKGEGKGRGPIGSDICCCPSRSDTAVAMAMAMAMAVLAESYDGEKRAVHGDPPEGRRNGNQDLGGSSAVGSPVFTSERQETRNINRDSEAIIACWPYWGGGGVPRSPGLLSFAVFLVRYRSSGSSPCFVACVSCVCESLRPLLMWCDYLDRFRSGRLVRGEKGRAVENPVTPS